MSSLTTKELEILAYEVRLLRRGQVEMAGYMERLARSLEDLEQRLAKLEPPPSDKHIKMCACQQCLDLQFGSVEPNLHQEADDPPTPLTRCSLCDEEYCPYC